VTEQTFPPWGVQRNPSAHCWGKKSAKRTSLLAGSVRRVIRLSSLSLVPPRKITGYDLLPGQEIGVDPVAGAGQPFVMRCGRAADAKPTDLQLFADQHPVTVLKPELPGIGSAP